MENNMKNSGKSDFMQVGDGISADDAGWNFSGAAAKEFDNHVRKSIPLYQEAQDLIINLSDYFVSENSLVYDIGTATGEVTLNLGAKHADREGTQFIGLDVEKDMINEAQKKKNQIRAVKRFIFGG